MVGGVSSRTVHDEVVYPPRPQRRLSFAGCTLDASGGGHIVIVPKPHAEALARFMRGKLKLRSISFLKKGLGCDVFLFPK